MIKISFMSRNITKKTTSYAFTSIVITILTLCLFTACGSTSSPDDGAVIEPPTATATESNGAGGFVYLNSGATFEIDAPAADALAKVGEPLSYFEASSCAFGEQDKVWTYQGFRVDTYQLDGIDYILDVILTDDTVMTSEGVRIGDSTDDILAAYGTPTLTDTNYMIYESGDMRLAFLLNGDTITTIEYLSKKLD